MYCEYLYISAVCIILWCEYKHLQSYFFRFLLWHLFHFENHNHGTAGVRMQRSQFIDSLTYSSSLNFFLSPSLNAQDLLCAHCTHNKKKIYHSKWIVILSFFFFFRLPIIIWAHIWQVLKKRFLTSKYQLESETYSMYTILRHYNWMILWISSSVRIIMHRNFHLVECGFEKQICSLINSSGIKPQ